MTDLDFEQLEKLIDGEEQKLKRERRSLSVDRSRSRSYRGHSPSRSRSPRGRSRTPPQRRPARYQSRTPSPIRRQRREEERKIRRIERERREAEETARKAQEDAKRDELTVLIMNLSLKATEKDVWRFLTDNCGKVRDIQIVRDARSNKSKGVAYVEFYEQESVLRAFNISGQAYILGQPIRIQASQAERNRAAKIAKQQAQEILAEDGPMKVYVGGLVGSLAVIDMEEIQQLFTPFGTITSVEYQRDSLTGKSKGFAFLIFSKSSDARDAIQAMNGFEIAGQQIKVGHAAEQPVTPQAREQTSLEKAQQRLMNAQRIANGDELPDKVEDPDIITRLEDEENGSVLHGDAKVALMRKLARDRINMPTGPDTNVFRADVQMIGAAGAGASVAQAAAQVQKLAAGAGATVGAVDSKNFVLHPLFSKEEVESEGRELLEDIVEDVRDEIENIGAVQAVYIDDKELDGKVYVRFVHREHAVLAATKMAGRKYSGNTIELSWISDQAWLQITGSPL